MAIVAPPQTRIIHPDYWYANKVDTTYFKNPLVSAEWTSKIDDPLFEIAGLSFYSIAWASKYLLNTELAPYQCAFLYLLWTKKYPLLLASRGASKTFILAVYCILRALFDQGSKVVVVSSTFRQAKHIFEEVCAIYKRAPLLRACVRNKPHKSVDFCEFNIGTSRIKWLPMGNGGNIRGERGSHIIIDEIDSVNPEVMHVVIRGFAATQLDPMSKIKEAAKRQRDGIVRERKPGEGNQIVIAGTAGFEGGNFHKLYKQYTKIILSEAKGYGYELTNELGDDYGDTWIDYNEYGMIELPWKFVPEGMLDWDMIANARMTMSKMLFDMEYECKFANASQGFFKHVDIVNATAKGSDSFMVKSYGIPGRECVMGVDPARTSDAFAIVILELGKVRRLIYCYTYINKPFSFGVKKIRQLMKKFDIKQIGMDSQGGGLAVRDLLMMPEMSSEDNLPVFEIDSENKAAPGHYILKMVNPTTKWIEDANFMLQKNIEDRDLLFPSTILAGKRYSGENIDELDTIYAEVEECKRELTQISVTQTVTGLRHFDLEPSIEDKKRKIKPRKDRYSALLIANSIARDLDASKNPQVHALQKWYNPHNYGGWAEEFETY
jgi:hypothetical protein